MTDPFAIGDELLAEELNDLTMTFTEQLIAATGTWVKPDGCSRLFVRGVGSGGGSGGVAATGAGDMAASGGGGSGGYFEKLFLASALANSESVTINAAGTGGAAGANNGGTGGATTFADGKAYILTGNGGVGGTGSFASAGASFQGGAGGTATGGTLNIRGGIGGIGMTDGGPTAQLANWGGMSKLSGQAPALTASGVGNAGELYGGGGGGSFNSVSQAARAGAAGALGGVLLWNCF